MGRFEQSLEQRAILTDSLREEYEKKLASQIETMRSQLQDEHQKALDRERDEWRAKVASLEMAAAKREDELASLSQLRNTIGQLGASGSLSSLGRALEVLNSVAGPVHQNPAAICEPHGLPAA